jgi:MFS family permease
MRKPPGNPVAAAPPEHPAPQQETAPSDRLLPQSGRPGLQRETAEDGKRGAEPTSRRSLYGLDWVNFFLADVQTGVGPFLAIYLAASAWDPEKVGLALTIGGIAGIVTQTPAGALVDRLRAKRLLIAIAAAALCVGALIIAWWPRVPVVLGAQVLIGGVSSIFNPAVAAIALGLVGHKRFDVRQGRNQSWNAAGNIGAAVSMGVVGTYVAPKWIFYMVLGFAIPTILSLLLIRSEEIDYELARGARDGVGAGRAGFMELLKDKVLLVFLACVVLFHFANAAMLPLVGEMLSQGKAKTAPLFMMGCVVVTQAVITLLAWPAGKFADKLGRKPILLIGFAALPIRGLLLAFIHNTYGLLAVQILDGIGAGIFGVVAILVIADLTRGTGRFNVTQGAIFTALGIGASLSQVIAGAIVHHAGYRVGFLFLTVIAAAALALLWLAVPETCHWAERYERTRHERDRRIARRMDAKEHESTDL